MRTNAGLAVAGCSTSRSDEVWEVSGRYMSHNQTEDEWPRTSTACKAREQKGGVVWLGSAALDGTERATTPQEALFVEEIGASPRASICGQLALWCAGGYGNNPP